MSRKNFRLIVRLSFFHRLTLKYAKYLSGVTVLVAMVVFVLVLVDMAVGFKDKSKYFVALFIMYVAADAVLGTIFHRLVS